ncbi:MAG: hypothetical protein JJU36_14055 [Phycisphaeraceae bacterium]|nr:hypothetical protein [Phycisphaeraceae bacterium]
MKFRKATFLDLYADKLAIAIAAAFAILVVAMFFVMDSYRVNVPGLPRAASLGDVGPEVRRRADQLQRQLNTVPDVVQRIEAIETRHAEAFAQSIIPTRPEPTTDESALVRAALRGVGGARVIDEAPIEDPFERFVVPQPGAPTITSVRVGRHLRTPWPENPSLDQAIRDALPQRDFQAVHVRGQWNMARWYSRLNQRPEAGTQMPRHWRERGLWVTDVVLQRQTLDPNTGEWGPVETIAKLPTTDPLLNFRSLPENIAPEEARRRIRAVEENQDIIRIPIFVPTAIPWPLETIDVSRTDAQRLARFDADIDRVNRLIAQMERRPPPNPETLTRERERLVTLKREQAALVERVTSVPWPGLVELYPALPASRVRLPEAGSPQDEWDDAPPAPPRPQPRRPGGRSPLPEDQPFEEDWSGVRANPSTPNVFMTSAPSPRRDARWEDHIEDDPEFDNPYRPSTPVTPRSPRTGPSAQQPGRDGGPPTIRMPDQRAPDDLEQLPDPDAIDAADLPTALEVWAHDITVQPGKTYRYRIAVAVENPLFRQPNLHDEQRHLAHQINLVGQFSEPWSDPVQIDPPSYAFLVSVAQSNATFEIWRLVRGIWTNHRFSVLPGDQVGGEVTDEGGRRTIRSDEVLVDIVQPTPGTSVRRQAIYMRADRSDLIVREPEQELNNPERLRLVQLEKLMNRIRETFEGDAGGN